MNEGIMKQKIISDTPYHTLQMGTPHGRRRRYDEMTQKNNTEKDHPYAREIVSEFFYDDPLLFAFYHQVGYY